MGSDLGGALKGFKSAMGDDDKDQDQTQLSESAEDIDGETVDSPSEKTDK